MGNEQLDVTAKSATTSTTHQEYQVVMVDPNTAIPQHRASGSKDTTVTVLETARAEPVLVRPMTPMEKYNEMLDDLPEVPTSSSSSAKSVKFSTDSSSGSNGGVAKIMKTMGPTHRQAWESQKPQQVS